MFVFLFASLLVFPLVVLSHPDPGAALTGLRPPERPGRLHLERGAADHRHRRHDRRTVAALLPAVQRHRQAHHAALARLREGGHRARRGRGRGRRRRDHDGVRIGVHGHRRLRPLRRTRWASRAGWPTHLVRSSARSSPCCCSTHRSSARRRSRLRPRTRSATSSVCATRCTGASARRSSSTARTPRWWRWRPRSC